ncbi:DNA mismatch repair protein MutL [Paenibacillus sp. 598K]|nr:DNA mismatch repair protein MutL [Paenibacillus sp. 598K]
MGEQLANQIAAGEVVERPSSVVKELVENAVDAGSSRIDITIEEGGLQLIRITDNGGGIEEDDMALAFQRHATSKLLTGKDLFRIASLGFRGEALPSIAAVSRIECVSATETSGLGRRLVIEGGKELASEPYNCEQGTDMTVRDLFYNTPARLKYMKSIQTELGHISDYVYRLALAHPGIAFTLTHNGNTLLRTVGNGDRLQVIAAVYGRTLAKAMLPVKGESPDYHINGYISRPEQTRANRGGLTMIVNGRYIRSFILNQAIQHAYHTLLPINRFPVAVLEIGMHPTLVDVNVHPSKMEVRFSKESELRELVQRLVREALAGQAHIPGPASGSGKRGKPLYTQGVISFHREEAAPAAELPLPPVAPPPVDPPPQAERETSYRAPGPHQQRPTTTVPPRAAERLYKPSEAGGGSSLTRERAETAVDRAWSSSWPLPDAASEPREGVPGDVFAPESRQLADTRSVSGRGDAATSERADDTGGQTVEPSDASLGYANGATTPSTPPNLAQLHRRTDDEASGGQADLESAGASDATAPGDAPAAAPATGTPAPYASPSAGPAATGNADSSAFPELSWVGQLHGTYLIAQNEEGMYLIDQHAAHERIHYEYYAAKFGQPEQASQQLLVPMTLEYTSAEAQALSERMAWFEEAGVELEPFGPQTFLVRSHPAWFPKGEEQQIIEEMAEWILTEKRAVDIGKLREKSAILCSCKASIKANQRLSREEGETLLRRLAACGQPYTCPHGRPILVHISVYQLEKMFKRVMS